MDALDFSRLSMLIIGPQIVHIDVWCHSAKEPLNLRSSRFLSKRAGRANKRASERPSSPGGAKKRGEAGRVGFSLSWQDTCSQHDIM